MTQTLSDEEVTRLLETRKGWRQVDASIMKTFHFKTFPEAVAFVDRLVMPSEVASHHPDISINYNRVTLKLWTHDAGGLTAKDFTLADEIDQIH